MVIAMVHSPFYYNLADEAATTLRTAKFCIQSPNVASSYEVTLQYNVIGMQLARNGLLLFDAIMKCLTEVQSCSLDRLGHCFSFDGVDDVLEVSHHIILCHVPSCH
jgi:hypothetical protein